MAEQLRGGVIGGTLLTSAQWTALGAAGYDPGRDFIFAAAAAGTFHVELYDGSRVAIAIPATGGQAMWAGQVAICSSIIQAGTTFPSAGIQVGFHIDGQGSGSTPLLR